jgi:hypothetical protein
MEDFWLDKAKSDNWSFRFFIRHELKWTIFRMSVCFAPEAAIASRIRQCLGIGVLWKTLRLLHLLRACLRQPVDEHDPARR